MAVMLDLEAAKGIHDTRYGPMSREPPCSSGRFLSEGLGLCRRRQMKSHIRKQNRVRIRIRLPVWLLQPAWFAGYANERVRYWAYKSWKSPQESSGWQLQLRKPLAPFPYHPAAAIAAAVRAAAACAAAHLAACPILLVPAVQAERDWPVPM